MVKFITLNDGRNINLTHISEITANGKDVIYKSAKGSLEAITEHFESESEANNRFEELQNDLVV